MRGTLWYTGFDEAALASIKAHFEKLLNTTVDFEFIEDKSLIGGFVAHVNGKAYDMSFKKRLAQAHAHLDGEVDGLNKAEDESYTIPEAMFDKLDDFRFSSDVYTFGKVVSSADGIIQVVGLKGTRYGEMLEISGGAIALALEISEEKVGAAVLSGEAAIEAQVGGTGHVLQAPIGRALLGRVLSPTGEPLDGGERPECSQHRPIEIASPKIMERKAVSRPIQTGILSIDSMIPIGRGQRELIIGDRQTGKTTIAVDTILNQKGQNVICVYCAIGQKASSVAEVVETLTKGGAMPYTVVVASMASDLPAMQYISPYSACAIAEGFAFAGEDVLIVYDDLSKHAVSYRTVSLLLHRPPGREAYPGDVFYLHSRLLERSAQLSDELGGGSLTALPIVETMSGDISAYIPTNVISITDGQIYLESELFHAGMRPAINVGLSVSRVGRSAQRAAMRKVTGTLRLDLAQYREMSVFLQFGADVDSATKQMLENGARKNELLKQNKHVPYSLSQEVCLLLAADSGIYSKFPLSYVPELSRKMLQTLKDECTDILEYINAKYDMDDAMKEKLLSVMEKAAEEYSKQLEQ